MSAFHQALTRCATYPDRTARVEHRETHVSHLYLTDSLVYKIKKNVDFGFCNFTSLERRRFFCEEEVRLNRRLAPDCYLGVSKIVRQGEQFLIDQPGEIIEYAVRMRRLPQDRMLIRLLEAKQPSLTAEIARVGQFLARFHGQAPRIDRLGHDDQRSMLFYWQQNFDQTRGCVDPLIRPASFATLEQLVMRFLHDNAGLLEQRQELGYVRDGHGDLHCEHICLTETLQIFDCIEFNPQLRYGDIINDLAFLYMDLEFRQRTDLAQALWQSYRCHIATGPQATKLRRFYCLYRAWVRAKIHHFQITATKPAAAQRQQAHAYFRLACSYALPQMLLICCGLIGSGKSTVAQDLGSALRAPVISSDLIRPPAETDPTGTGYDQGRYSPENRLAVYRLMAEQVEAGCASGRTLIVDATFETRQMRAIFRELAEHLRIPCAFIEVTCDPALIRARLRTRPTDPQKAGGSEARLAHFERQRSRFEPLASEDCRMHVNTGQPREYNVDFLLETLLHARGTLE